MSLSPTITRCAALACASLCLAGPARAGDNDRIYSYDAVSDTAQTLARGGLTFVLHKQRLGGARVTKVMSTQDHGTAELKPASDKDLGPGGLAGVIGHKVREDDLYEIQRGGQGEPLIRAACPLTDRAWLAFGALKPNRNLVIHALGHSPINNKVHLCTTMEFSWHGEWKLPIN
jgi:hypothetical protein